MTHSFFWMTSSHKMWISLNCTLHLYLLRLCVVVLMSGQTLHPPSRRGLGKGKAFNWLSPRGAPLPVSSDSLWTSWESTGSCLILITIQICHSTTSLLGGKCCSYLPCYSAQLLARHPLRTSCSSLCSDSWHDYPWKYGFVTGLLAAELLPDCEF